MKRNQMEKCKAGGDSSFDLDWYGCVKMDASYDQNPTSNGGFVMWLKPEPSVPSGGQFNMTHKQTRIGLRAKKSNSQNAAVKAKAAGRLEFDFYGGGGAENKAFLQLRHGDRSINQNIFGNIKYSPLPKFTVGMEVSRVRFFVLKLISPD